ncbi:hypothetical protein Tco_1491665 [Tanacetum coccineum]
MDGCTKGPQLEEGENLNTRAPGTWRTPPGGTSTPAGQTQGGPSPAFVQENIDEILAMDNVKFPPPPPMVGTPEKQNMNKFCGYHQDRGHNTNDCYHLKKQIEEAVASGRLTHLEKDIRQSG